MLSAFYRETNVTLCIMLSAFYRDVCSAIDVTEHLTGWRTRLKDKHNTHKLTCACLPHHVYLQFRFIYFFALEANIFSFSKSAKTLAWRSCALGNSLISVTYPLLLAYINSSLCFFPMSGFTAPIKCDECFLAITFTLFPHSAFQSVNVTLSTLSP